MITTTRNPKVLNYTEKHKLQGLLAEVQKYEDQLKNGWILKGKNADGKEVDLPQESIQDYTSRIDHNTDAYINGGVIHGRDLEGNTKDFKVQSVQEYIDEFNTAVKKVQDTAEVLGSKLDDMIKSHVYDPNLPSTDTRPEYEKTLESYKAIENQFQCMSYGFIVDGEEYAVLGTANHGIAIVNTSKDTIEGKDIELRSPRNNKFYSYYINDILKDDSTTALIATNAGLVKYSLVDNKYSVVDRSCGINTDTINCIAKINTNHITGYLLGTESGLNYSALGKMWSNVNSKFTNKITCFSTIDKLNTVQSSIFIGTSKGLYYVKGDEIAADGTTPIYEVTIFSKNFYKAYINSVSYDTESDKLLVGCNGGLIVISDISKVMAEKIESPEYINIYRRVNGVAGNNVYGVYTSPKQLYILGCTNGITVTRNFVDFKTITTTINNVIEDGKKLNYFDCQKIIYHKPSEVNNLRYIYTILHSTGLTEDIELE